MPISLPNSPTNGQTVQIGTVVYTYDATAGVWNSEFESGVSSIVHTSDTAPLNPNDGDMWFDSSIGKTFIWYNDGSSSQWIQMNPNTGGSGGGANLGSVSESIIPDTDIAYDLGSSSKKFNDLYLSGSTLNLGNQSISATASGIVVPELQIGSGTNNVKLTTNASGNLITTETDSSGNSGGASPAGGAATIVADMAGLIALTGMSAGSQAYVSANNRLYFYTGTGWYLIATVQNDAPSAITGVDGSYTLAADGTATTVTAVSTDPEGFALTWSYTASGLGSIATVSQADNVFTVTPSTDAANAGSFTLTISATDGINGAVSTAPSFTLSFSITNSRYTSLSVKATNTGSNQTFDDASTSNHTITAAGDVTASTFSPHRHGGYSAYFDGTDNISVANHADFNVGSSDFTLECWAYLESVGGGLCGVYHSATNQRSYGILVGSSENFSAPMSSDGTYTSSSSIDSGVAVSNYLNQWVHLALTKSGTNATLYLNGNSVGTTSSAPSTLHASTETDAFTVAGAAGKSTGYISNVRLVKGSVVYSSNFTPPTAPLTAITNTKFLLGRLPYLKDQSASNHTINASSAGSGAAVSLEPKSLFDNAPYLEASHGASAYFDGTGDYISTANHADFNFGSGNFTIESYVYYTDNIVGNQAIVAQWHTPPGVNKRAFQLRREYGSTGSFKFYWSTDGSDYPYIQSTGIDLNTMYNQWIHVAVVRNGNTITMYVNGTDVVNTTLTGSLYDNTTDDIFIGSRSNNPPNIDHQTVGYISDLRVVKGTAIYTSNFTPPTEPLTAVTNTKFLLNPETSISDLSQRNTLSPSSGLATSTTQVKFAGTKSIDFNGNYLTIANGTPSTTDMTLHKEFTIEFWAYLNATSGTQIFFGSGGGTANWDATTGNETSIFFYLNRLYHQSSQGSSYHSDYASIPAVVQTGEWQHWAITCDANADCKWYLNGTLMWSYAHVFPTKKTGTIWRAVIGAGSSFSDSGINGYIQDYRITRGLVRYTANFTPPTAELQG